MKIQCLLILLTFFALTSNAQSDRVLSLKDCIELGLMSNYDIRIQKENQKISENNVNYGFAGGLPLFGINGGLNDNHVNNLPGNSARQGVNGGVDMGITVFQGFKVRTTFKKLKELESLGLIQTRIVIEDIIADIAQAYFTILRQEEKVANLESFFELSKERLEIVEKRYELGEASLLEYQSAKVDFNTDNSNLLSEKVILEEQFIVLYELLALDPLSEKFNLVNDGLFFSPIESRDSVINTALENNARLKAVESNIDIKELDLKIAQSVLMPKVDFKAGYSYGGSWQNVFNDRLNHNLTLNYGLTMRFNFLESVTTKFKRDNAKIAIKVSNLEKEAFANELEAQVVSLWNNYENSMIFIRLEKENEKSAQSLYDTAFSRYSLGEYSGIELREAQNNLLKAQEKLSIAEFNAKDYEILLLHISGDIVDSMIR